MSGHSKWASIKHKKGAADAKRGAAFTKMIRELTTVAKNGGGNPDTNSALRAAIIRAKGINMPLSNIDNAIKKGTGELPGVVYEATTFDARGPNGVAILIDTLTDNKNRTTAEIRNLLSKKSGNLAGAGSVAYLFHKKGYITIEKSKIAEDVLMDIILEAGADDIKSEGELYEVTCDPASFEAVKEAIEVKKIPTATSEVTLLPDPKFPLIPVTGSEAKQVLELMEALEDHEDVQHVYANFDIPDEEMEKVTQQQ